MKMNCGYFEETMEHACELFVESRRREGENLGKDILEKLEGMMVHVAFIEEKISSNIGGISTKA